MTPGPRFRRRLFLALLVVVFASLLLQSWLIFRVGEVFLGIRDPAAYLLAGALPLLWQLAPMILVSGWFFGRRLEFLHSVAQRLHRKQEVSLTDLSRAKRDFLAIPRWVWGICFLGFGGGVVQTAVLDWQRLFSLAGVLQVLFQLASGALFASLLVALFGRILQEVRRILHPKPTLESLNKRHSRQRQALLLAFFLSGYLVSFALMVGMTWAEMQNQYIRAVQAVLAGENSESVSKAYFDQVRKDFPTAGTATKDDLLAIVTGVDTVGMFFLPVALLLLALACGVWWISSREPNEQLVRLRDRLNEALAEGRLSRDLELVEYDEIGEMVSAINQLTELQNKRVHLLTRAAVSVRQASQPLTKINSRAQEASRALQESSASIAAVTELERNSVAQTETKVADALKSFDALVLGVEAQAQHVATTSGALMEMATRMDAVTKSSKQAKSLAQKLKVNTASGTNALASAVLAIQSIETASIEVDKLTSDIAKVATRTNLLAMNAAIEAAHAGTNGRGFAVVAEEVRELANSSSATNTKIKKKITQMLSLVTNGVHQSTEVGHSFDKINEDIAATSALVSEIANAMEEQEVGTEEILRSSSALVKVSARIGESSVSQKEQNRQLREAVAHLSGSLESLRGNSSSLARDCLQLEKITRELDSFQAENHKALESLAAAVQATGESNLRSAEEQT